MNGLENGGISAILHDKLARMGGTVSRIADRWYLSVTVEIPDLPSVHRENQTVVGVDLGVFALATLSTGEKIVGPEAYAAALAQLLRLSTQFNRQMEAAKVRPAHPQRDAYPMVEEYAQDPPAHHAASCAHREYPRECLAPVDYPARGAV